MMALGGTPETPIVPEVDIPRSFFMAFGQENIEVLCDFTGIVGTDNFIPAYDTACDLHQNKAGSLGRFTSLDDAQEAGPKAKILKWNGEKWAEESADESGAQ